MTKTIFFTLRWQQLLKYEEAKLPDNRNFVLNLECQVWLKQSQTLNKLRAKCFNLITLR